MPYSILIAEDEKDILEIIVKSIASSRYNFSTLIAPNGKVAFEIASEQLPDLILLDWNMPVMSGFEALKKIKSNEKTKDIPVIMVTVETTSLMLKDALEAGAVDYIKKPIDKVELIARINAVYKESCYKKEIIQKNKELNELNKKIELQNKELTRSNDDLKRFAAIVSHDLKEPLRKIYFNVERFVQGKENNNGNKSIIEKTRATLKRMDQLIKDILVYSKVNYSNANYENCNMNEIINDILVDLEARIAETQATVNVENLPIIKGGKMHFRQIFQNLISNAIKFHKTNVPSEVKVECKKTDNAFWVFKVTDNGIGFDEKYADRIFSPFQRLHSHSEFEGTGLGASICSRIVELYGGKITAKSEINKGSVFTVYLPIIE